MDIYFSIYTSHTGTCVCVDREISSYTETLWYFTFIHSRDHMSLCLPFLFSQHVSHFSLYFSRWWPLCFLDGAMSRAYFFLVKFHNSKVLTEKRNKIRLIPTKFSVLSVASIGIGNFLRRGFSSCDNYPKWRNIFLWSRTLKKLWFSKCTLWHMIRKYIYSDCFISIYFRRSSNTSDKVTEFRISITVLKLILTW